MIKTNIVQNIGKKEMDRKDFLKYGGLAVLSLAGVGNIVSVLTRANGGNLTANESHQRIAQGYGSSGYGS